MNSAESVHDAIALRAFSMDALRAGLRTDDQVLHRARANRIAFTEKEVLDDFHTHRENVTKRAYFLWREWGNPNEADNWREAQDLEALELWLVKK